MDSERWENVMPIKKFIARNLARQPDLTTHATHQRQRRPASDHEVSWQRRVIRSDSAQDTSLISLSNWRIDIQSKRVIYGYSRVLAGHTSSLLSLRALVVTHYAYARGIKVRGSQVDDSSSGYNRQKVTTYGECITSGILAKRAPLVTFWLFGSQTGSQNGLERY